MQDPDCWMNLPERRRVRMPLVGLACAAGDRLPLERGLSEVSGVLDVYLNPVDEAAYLTVDPARFRLDEARAVAERFGARTVVDEAPEPP